MTNETVLQALRLLEGALALAHRSRAALVEEIASIERAIGLLEGRVSLQAKPPTRQPRGPRPSAVCPRCGRTVALRHSGKSATSYDHLGASTRLGRTVSHRFNADTGEVTDTPVRSYRSST